MPTSESTSLAEIQHCGKHYRFLAYDIPFAEVDQHDHDTQYGLYVGQLIAVNVEITYHDPCKSQCHCASCPGEDRYSERVIQGVIVPIDCDWQKWIEENDAV